MPNIIKNGAIIEDTYQFITEMSVLPAADIVVSLDVWQQQRADVLAHPHKKGIMLKPDQHPEAIVDDLTHLDIIALAFPTFADGRGYSYAVLLRQRYGFKGELRATGDIFKDNLFYLKRCGFDSFVVRVDKDLEVALQGLQDFSECYQASTDESMPLYRRRIA